LFNDYQKIKGSIDISLKKKLLQNHSLKEEKIMGNNELMVYKIVTESQKKKRKNNKEIMLIFLR